MTEDFLSRWARLKRESAAELAPARDTALCEPAPEPLDPRAAPPIDLAELPPIESISAESSIAAFLQAGVPEDLRRAALRSAWVTDPSIRDFVGIAENQWDFNGEGTIAGFGSLSVEEYARYVAARALSAKPGVWSVQEGLAPGEDKPDKASAAGLAGECTAAPSTTTAALQRHPVAQGSINQPQIAATMPESASQTTSRSPKKRTHGSALPK